MSTDNAATEPTRVTDSSLDAGVRTTVHLLRHGKVHNPEAILYGRLPGYYLSQSGLAMAEAAAASLDGHDIRYLVASSLLRAQQTARPIAAAHGLDIVTDDRVIEADNVFAGTRPMGPGGSLRKPRNWRVLYNPVKPSWGEPYLDIAHRMLASVYDAVEVASGHEAVIVSHQLPIWTLRRYLSGQRLWHNPSSRQCAVASLTSLDFVDGVFTGLRYSAPAAHIVAADDPFDYEPEAGA